MNNSGLTASFTPKILQQKCYGRESCGHMLLSDAMRVIRDKMSGEDQELCPKCYVYYQCKSSTVSRSSGVLFSLNPY